MYVIEEFIFLPLAIGRQNSEFFLAAKGDFLDSGLS